MSRQADYKPELHIIFICIHHKKEKKSKWNAQICASALKHFYHDLLKDFLSNNDVTLSCNRASELQGQKLVS